MRGRILKVSVVICGLAGAVYAADQATGTPEPTLQQTIAQQLAAEGQQAQDKGETKDFNNLSADQMLAQAVSYDAQMRQAVAQSGDAKIQAYRSHDIIRMTCIDDKVDQMKTVITMVESRYLMLRTFKSELLVMRSQFAIISAANERVSALAGQIQSCMGDSLDGVNAGRIQEEIMPTDNLNDPTRPQTSLVPIERPPAASPYN
jgi:hypothetical protein